jgi:hypothetical protein
MLKRLIDSYRDIVRAATVAFKDPRARRKAEEEAIGLICGDGPKTITSAIRWNGRQHLDWSSDYKLFSRAKWSHDDLFRPIIEEALGSDSGTGQYVVTGTDDTLIRKTGRKTPGTAYARDPLSPPFHVNLVLGQRFVQSSIMVRAGGPGTQWRAVPAGFVHAPPLKPPHRATPEQIAEIKERRKKHNVSTFAAKELHRLSNEVRHFSGGSKRMIHCVDGSFASKVYMGGAPHDVTIVARGRKNARLRAHLPADRRSGNRKYGDQLPTPEETLRDKSIPWKGTRLFIAGKWRMLKYKEVSSVCWPRVACDKPMRLIVIKPAGYRLRKGSRLLYRQPAFLFALNSECIPLKTLVEAYLARWEIEVTFRDAKTVIGVGQAQVWNKTSVEKAPAFVAACHACLLLATIQALGDRRSDEVFGTLPAWRKMPQMRPSVRELVNLIRKEAADETLVALEENKMAS